MVTDRKHSSDVSSEQEVIRRTEKIAQSLAQLLAQSLGLDEQNAGAYSIFFRENSVLKKELKYYHSQHNTLEKRVKRLERDVKDLDECVDRKTVVDLIQKIVPSLVREKSLI
ncbi:hypothetical protein RhiirC2_816696, partial [Rhizophagus irregularis]